MHKEPDRRCSSLCVLTRCSAVRAVALFVLMSCCAFYVREAITFRSTSDYISPLPAQLALDRIPPYLGQPGAGRQGVSLALNVTKSYRTENQILAQAHVVTNTNKSLTQRTGNDLIPKTYNNSYFSQSHTAPEQNSGKEFTSDAYKQPIQTIGNSDITHTHILPTQTSFNSYNITTKTPSSIPQNIVHDTDTQPLYINISDKTENPDKQPTPNTSYEYMTNTDTPQHIQNTVKPQTAHTYKPPSLSISPKPRLQVTQEPPSDTLKGYKTNQSNQTSVDMENNSTSTKMSNHPTQHGDSSIQQHAMRFSDDLQNRTRHLVTSMCPGLGSKMAAALSRWTTPLISDILLIVTMNSAQVFSNLHRVEAIHRPVFKHIAYCGPQKDIFLQTASNMSLDYNFTFVEIKSWWYYYECVSTAMNLNLPVKGYLTIGDDVLLNTWNILKLNRDRVWTPPDLPVLNLNGSGMGPKPWVHFRKWYGGIAINRTFEMLNKLSRSNTSTITTTDPGSGSEMKLKLFASDFLKTYDKTVGRGGVVIGSGDVFYIPDILKEKFTKVADLFRRNNCFVEMALYTIIFGLSEPSTHVSIQGQGLWKGNRVSPWDFYNESSVFLHPFKFQKHVDNNPEGRTFYCKCFLKRYEEFLTSH